MIVAYKAFDKDLSCTSGAAGPSRRGTDEPKRQPVPSAGRWCSYSYLMTSRPFTSPASSRSIACGTSSKLMQVVTGDSFPVRISS